MSARSLDPPRQKIALPLQPKPDESFIGYLCRIAEWNFISQPADLVRDLARWPPNDLSTADRKRLAVTLGCDPKALNRLFKRSYQNGLSPRIQSWHRRRVAPASLRLSSHHRLLWQVNLLPFCPESWGALIDRCPQCREVLTWRTPSFERCQACFLDLKAVDTAIAEESVRGELGAITRLLTDASPIPPEPWWSDVLTGPETFELIALVGQALGNPERCPRTAGRRLVSGARLLAGFPGSVRSLANVDRNEPENPFFRRLAARASGRAGPLKEAIRLLVRSRPDLPGIIRLQMARVNQGLMTATDLAAELKIQRAELRRLINGGVLGKREPRGRLRAYDWFSREDLKQLQNFLGGRVSAYGWAQAIGLTEVDARQLLAFGLVTEASDELVRTTFASLQLDARSAAVFEQSVRSCAERGKATPDWMPIKDAFRGFGGGYKPWALLLESALHDSLPHGLGWPLKGGFKIGTILIHPDAVDWLRGPRPSVSGSTFSPTAFDRYRPDLLAWGEVETLLNCQPADVAKLLELGLIQRLNRNKVADFVACSVERFAERHISSLEVAAVAGVTTRKATLRLLKAGLSRSEAGFWLREAVSGVLEGIKD